MEIVNLEKYLDNSNKEMMASSACAPSYKLKTTTKELPNRT